jgi:hypothetical protein
LLHVLTLCAIGVLDTVGAARFCRQTSSDHWPVCSEFGWRTGKSIDCEQREGSESTGSAYATQPIPYAAAWRQLRKHRIVDWNVVVKHDEYYGRRI